MWNNIVTQWRGDSSSTQDVSRSRNRHSFSRIGRQHFQCISVEIRLNATTDCSKAHSSHLDHKYHNHIAWLHSGTTHTGITWQTRFYAAAIFPKRKEFGHRAIMGTTEKFYSSVELRTNSVISMEAQQKQQIMSVISTFLPWNGRWSDIVDNISVDIRRNKIPRYDLHTVRNLWKTKFP